MVIPRDAVVQALDGAEVYVIKDGAAQARPVALGSGLGSFVVVDEGVLEKDVLVVRGQRDIVHGETVSISAEKVCCSDQLAAYRNGSEASAPNAPATPAAAAAKGAEESEGAPATVGAASKVLGSHVSPDAG